MSGGEGQEWAVVLSNYFSQALPESYPQEGYCLTQMWSPVSMTLVQITFILKKPEKLG